MDIHAAVEPEFDAIDVEARSTGRWVETALTAL